MRTLKFSFPCVQSSANFAADISKSSLNLAVFLSEGEYSYNVEVCGDDEAAIQSFWEEWQESQRATS